MLAVNIVCVGDVDSEVVDFVSAGLAQDLEATVTGLDPVALPRETYDPHRRQYSSTGILQSLQGVESLRSLRGLKPPSPEPPPGEKASEPVLPVLPVLLAITSVDLFVPELNFVFGEAHPSESSCIISLARLGYSYQGAPVPRNVLLERALKEAIHEIGHVLGLGHCGRRTCVMFFSNSIRDTDTKLRAFCPSCLRRLTP